MNRRVETSRRTRETDIRVVLDLDGAGQAQVATGLGFLDHMLALLAGHGLLDLEIRAQGDLDVDGHHTVEDVGLTLGQALGEALGDKAGITRYGSALVPMDEALAQAVVDLSGRPHLSWRVELSQERIGEFETGLIREFFQALVNEARITLHLEARHGASDHHVIEALYKAFARALRQAASPDPRRVGVPSTKGVL